MYFDSAGGMRGKQTAMLRVERQQDAQVQTVTKPQASAPETDLVERRQEILALSLVVTALATQILEHATGMGKPQATQIGRCPCFQQGVGF